MSSRQLRKLQQQRELEEAARRAEEVGEESDSDASPQTPPKSKASLFANLAALEDEGEADGEKEDSGEEPLSEPELKPKPTPKAKKSKKKKKARQAKAKAVVEEEEDTQDIDAALKELSLQKPASGSWTDSKPTFDPQYEKICELVKIQNQHLKVANEMRNLFGRAAIENHDDAGGPVGRPQRQRGQAQQVDLETALKGRHAPGMGLPAVTLRRNHFIQGKDDWPKGTTGGLTMALVDDNEQLVDGTVEFRFVHNQSYQSMQLVFRQMVEIGSPQNLINFLISNPYHISTLIQVSKIAKDQTDHALSSDLLERVLFTFGRASLSSFTTKLAQGKARLDFTRPENREIWLAGYQYIKSLIMKGTYRTALEWAKLLLSLDPEDDPYCMRLMLHHLALRAHEFRWLLDFGKFTSDQENLIQGQQIIQKPSFTMYHNSPSLALAALQLKDGSKARELLTNSMQQLPWLFVSLFSELNLDSPPSIWGKQPRTDAEQLFTALYVQQCKDLWNTTEGTALLMEIAHTITKTTLRPIQPLSNNTMDVDVVRFIYLDNTPALMALVPSQLLHRSDNSDADPIPPYNNIHSYLIQEAPQHDPTQGGDRADPFMDFNRALFHRRVAEGIDSDEDHELEQLIRNDAGGMGSDDEEGEPAVEGHIQPNIVARLLNYVFRRAAGGNPGEDDSQEQDSDSNSADDMPDLLPMEDEDVEDNTDTEDEMPGLTTPSVDANDGAHTAEDIDTDDELPDLV